MKKFCVKCGKQFDAVGREVICPSCKAQVAEETKRAAVLRAKRASWTGESVPVRISGRASTVIRAYGKANNLPFAQALDDLLKASDYFKGAGQKWEDITPYKSRRMKKSDGEQDVPQASKPQEVKAAQDVQPQEAQEAQEARWMRQIKSAVLASKTSSKASKTSKASTSKAAKATKAAGKAASKK